MRRVVDSRAAAGIAGAAVDAWMPNAGALLSAMTRGELYARSDRQARGLP